MKQGRIQEKSLARIVWGWLFFMFMMIVVIYLVVHIAGHQTRVVGNSMYPTIADGDSIVIDRISYRFLSPRRFDVVIFPSQYQDDVYYVKRIIALPGETIQITNGSVYINGSLLKEKFNFGEIASAGIAQSQVILGEDEYFVLGDNRSESNDSREPAIGNIRRDNIVGKAWLRTQPLGRFGLIR